MSTLEGLLIVLAIDVIGLPALYVQIRRNMRNESQRDRIVREAHARAVTAREIDDLELAYNLPAMDPAWDASRERLWDAVRDNQNGDQP
jgi:hypothetical protein